MLRLVSAAASPKLEGFSAAMATAPVVLVGDGALAGLSGLAFPMDNDAKPVSPFQVPQEQHGSPMLDQVPEQDPFGQVHRQRRRQQIPRPPRRCFPSFNHEDGQGTTSCSYRTGDEEAELRRDCNEAVVCLRSPTNSTNMSEDGDSSLSCTSWSSGQLVWAKFSRSPWWPAQVVDSRTKTANVQPNGKTDVLVRFFGNYNYAWVDATSSLSKFSMNFQERSQVVTKAFQKGLKEAMEYRDFRKLPLKWRHSSWQLDECQTPQANGKESSEDTGSEAQDLERTTSARRRKPKVLYEDEERLHQKPKRNLRRKRIMRELGLAAPYGSPFSLSSTL